MTKNTTKSGSISRRRLLTTVSAGAALAASPFRINLLQAQEATIKIGFPVPLTGPYGAEAQDQVRAAEVAIAQFNDAGGLGGRSRQRRERRVTAVWRCNHRDSADAAADPDGFGTNLSEDQTEN